MLHFDVHTCIRRRNATSTWRILVLFHFWKFCYYRSLMKDFSSSKTRIAYFLCKHLHSLMVFSLDFFFFFNNWDRLCFPRRTLWGQEKSLYDCERMFYFWGIIWNHGKVTNIGQLRFRVTDFLSSSLCYFASDHLQIYINKIQRDSRVCRCLFTAKLLYVFRVSIAPVIRRTSNCKCSFWYRS